MQFYYIFQYVTIQRARISIIIKKMEIAFIRALRHILSDKYQYILVADRGFGNERFIQYCNRQWFLYND